MDDVDGSANALSFTSKGSSVKNMETAIFERWVDLGEKKLPTKRGLFAVYRFERTDGQPSENKWKMDVLRQRLIAHSASCK